MLHFICVERVVLVLCCFPIPECHPIHHYSTLNSFCDFILARAQSHILRLADKLFCPITITIFKEFLNLNEMK